jgi:glucosamine--fructose-6-phosphate aminotransferase (isomerizing)
MCGIVGYVGSEDAASVLTPALKRLEYRGYDSAGLATLHEGGLDVCRAVGRVADLERAVAERRPAGQLGIAHTRWATHGRPTELNAHPQVDCTSRVAVVHNGIIENYRTLRQQLLAEGHAFRSETDSEVFAHLLERYLDLGLPAAVARAASLVVGTFAVACIAEGAPDMIVAVRGGGSPLIVGSKDDEAYLASDVPALVGRTGETVVLEDGELAILTRGHVKVCRLDGEPVTRTAVAISSDRDAIEKCGHPHFMLKEILEQPDAVRNTLLERIDPMAGTVDLPELGMADEELAAISRMVFIACGSSWHAGLVGKWLVEAFGRLPAQAEIASEFRQTDPLLDSRALVVPISQSGETADTLGALRLARKHYLRSIAVCNRVGSSMSRDADGVLYTRAGLEIGVAATKSFTAQLVAVLLLALKVGQVRRTLPRKAGRELLRALVETPALMAQVIDESDAIADLAGRLADSSSCLYLGRGLQYPLALEGALKLKEISYIHAEGFPAGELKHGSIALIERGMPIVVLAPSDPGVHQIATSIQEVKARDGLVIALATKGDDMVGSLADFVIPIPSSLPGVQPLLMALALQLLAYHLAVLRGCDVDQPRNLAKSVTVE